MSLQDHSRLIFGPIRITQARRQSRVQGPDALYLCNLCNLRLL